MDFGLLGRHQPRKGIRPLTGVSVRPGGLGKGPELRCYDVAMPSCPHKTANLLAAQSPTKAEDQPLSDTIKLKCRPLAQKAAVDHCRPLPEPQLLWAEPWGYV